jgi:hypothetical protein
MSKKLKIAIISALMLGTASAAMAQTSARHESNYYACQIDEGQGRMAPCDSGGAGN